MTVDPGDKLTRTNQESLLGEFFLELHRFLKNLSAYPDRHPLIDASVQRTLSVFERALGTRDDIRIIVSREGFFAGRIGLDTAGNILGKFADSLFDRGVAAVTLKRGLMGHELRFFHELMSLDREQIWQRGFDEILSQTGTCNIIPEQIDFSVFSTPEATSLDALLAISTETDKMDPWREFLDLMLKELRHGAEMPVGENRTSTAVTGQESFEGLGDGLYLTAAQIETLAGTSHPADFAEKFIGLLRSMAPEQRRQFMSRMCTLAAEHIPTATTFFSNMPPDIAEEYLRIIEATEIDLPPAIAKILETLAASQTVADVRTGGESVQENKEADADFLNIVFRSVDTDYVPTEYRDKLRDIISNRPMSRQALKEVEALKETLSPQSIDRSTAHVLIEVLHSIEDDTYDEQLASSLTEVCTCLLEVGDFAALADYCQRLELVNASLLSSRKLNEFFTSDEFTGEVLEGAVTWGKSKYGEIRRLITAIGAPFVEPLLDRLAEEQNISTRRFFLECLEKIGPAARDSVVKRLDDSRWFFVRNLALILFGINDPSVAPSLRKLVGHHHPKVRFEVLRTLVHFDDPEATRLLLEDLESSNRDIRLNAIKISEKSRSCDVVRKLIGFLTTRDLIKYDLKLKVAAVRALSEIGNPEALPALNRLLQTKRLLHRHKHSLLKEEILNALGRFKADTN